MSAINLIFPHQLFKESPLFINGIQHYIIVEEDLFFNQFKFHKQKLIYHRTTMKRYESFLLDKGYKVEYIDATKLVSCTRKLIQHLANKKITSIHYIDPVDNWLHKKILEQSQLSNTVTTKLESPLFLNTSDDLSTFFNPEKKKFFQTKWYISQRINRNILLAEADKPVGGKWSYDAENRKKYPKTKTPPSISFPEKDTVYEDAVKYISKNYPDNLGLPNGPIYPSSFKTAREWLDTFLTERFKEFGTYEDAVVSSEHFLNHSVLTPMLNVGLITPQQIIDTTLSYAAKNDIPINSTEGFIRQIIGWREFIRGIYIAKGSQERTTNFWGFDRKIPASFYDGTTGIDPIDITIKKVNKTAYAHHIERLMVLGNFMLLCEFDPDEVYRWFMELFIDAYDWVMVPNVYGMSQFADGGLMSTKPYISGSNYLKKMTNYPKGPWQEIWDGLYWRFISVNRDFFLKNHRLSMMVRLWDKMDETKKETHLKNAEGYLSDDYMSLSL